MFKDLLGKEIKVGDHIFYAKSWRKRDIEEAIVIQCEEKFIKVEYLGIGSPPRYGGKKMPEGKKSRFTATDKKVIIISYGTVSDKDKDVFNRASKILLKKIEKKEGELKKSAKREWNLTKKNKLLQAEVDKIHERWDILDL